MRMDKLLHESDGKGRSVELGGGRTVRALWADTGPQSRVNIHPKHLFEGSIGRGVSVVRGVVDILG